MPIRPPLQLAAAKVTRPLLPPISSPSSITGKNTTSRVGASPGVTSLIAALVKIKCYSCIRFGGFIRVLESPVRSRPSASTAAPSGKRLCLDPNQHSVLSHATSLRRSSPVEINCTTNPRGPELFSYDCLARNDHSCPTSFVSSPARHQELRFPPQGHERIGSLLRWANSVARPLLDEPIGYSSRCAIRQLPIRWRSSG